MNKEDIATKLINIIHENNIIEGDIDFNASLITTYSIDSLKLVELIMLIEEKFEFEFDYSELNLLKFDTIHDIVLNICKAMEKVKCN